MRSRRFLFAAIATAAMLPAQSGLSATLSKGHRILLERGLQSHALAIKSDVFNINRVLGAEFTGVTWIWGEYDNSLLGPAPGIPWGRWVSDPGDPRTGIGDLNDMPPTTSPVNEAPYMSNLVLLQLGDEHDLNNATYRANTANWYNTVRANFPNTILYCNSWGYQLQDGNYGDYINTSNPDMLSMDTYEFTTNVNPAGSPAYLYHSMRQVRAFGSGYGKPYQLYTQTYHASGDVPPRRDPSDSELRLNYFAGAAFGFTSFIDFTYNTGASSLFVTPGGDTTTTPLYNTMTDINRKLKKLSPVLTRLKPRNNYIGGYDAAMAYYPGQYNNGGTATSLPPPDADFRVWPTDYLNFFAGNDPAYQSSSQPGWLRGMTVANIGNKNPGPSSNFLRGDIWYMWFKPLDEEFDGPNYTDERYMIIMNGLCDPTGSAAECRQTVTLNLVDVPQTQSLLVFNQNTGNVDTINPPLNSLRRQPTFTIDGGEMLIFKFNTGAPFVSFYQTDADDWGLYN